MSRQTETAPRNGKAEGAAQAAPTGRDKGAWLEVGGLYITIGALKELKEAG